MNCVSFLVAFNVNLWAMDHDFHTAMDLAAMNDRSEILNYLDKTAAKLEMNNK
jgi:ankyrin repeat protein